MASIRIEALEVMFTGLRRFVTEEITRLEAESIAIMTEVHEIASGKHGAGSGGSAEP